MIFRSKRNPRDVRTRLRVEELEERIAPVIVDQFNWVVGTEFSITRNAWGSDESDSDWYTIFYVGPGQADIRNPSGGASINGQHIGEITITGATLASGLYIVQTPHNDEPAISAEDIPWFEPAGSLWVQGNIDVIGDIGVIHIDGMFGPVYDPLSPWTQPTLTVSGNLGTFNVGMLMHPLLN